MKKDKNDMAFFSGEVKYYYCQKQQCGHFVFKNDSDWCADSPQWVLIGRFSYISLAMQFTAIFEKKKNITISYLRELYDKFVKERGESKTDDP